MFNYLDWRQQRYKETNIYEDILHARTYAK